MDEHIYASEPFKGVRINTSYSYGIDDQEFVVSFDSDYPQEFVDLVHRLRYTEASNYTLQDTPMYTCVKKRPRGGARRPGLKLGLSLRPVSGDRVGAVPFCASPFSALCGQR